MHSVTNIMGIPWLVYPYAQYKYFVDIYTYFVFMINKMCNIGHKVTSECPYEIGYKQMLLPNYI